MNSKLVKTFFVVCLIVLLAACGQQPPPVSAPTEAPTLDPPTATLPPTNTPLPTETPTPPPTETPLPTQTPTSTLTPTPEPSPTATNTPKPTATPTLAPGDVMYAADFKNMGDWMDFGFSFDTGKDTTNYTIEPKKDSLYMEVPEEYTSVYAVYADDMPKADVQLDVDTDTTGPARNNISLICRYTEDGWYELSVDSSGMWAIYRYDTKGGYFLLKDGGSTAIHMVQRQNHLTALCRGDTFTLFVNDVKVGTAKDQKFSEGRIGIGVATFQYGGTGITFKNLTARLPDPENLPGGAVAPTVPPAATPKGGKYTYPKYPLAGTSMAGAGLQANTMIMAVIYVVPKAPDCRDLSKVNTEFVEVTQKPVFNEQEYMIAGQWVERWTFDLCGTQVVLRITYTADGTGAIKYDVKYW